MGAVLGLRLCSTTNTFQCEYLWPLVNIHNALDSHVGFIKVFQSALNGSFEYVHVRGLAPRLHNGPYAPGVAVDHLQGCGQFLQDCRPTFDDEFREFWTVPRDALCPQ